MATAASPPLFAPPPRPPPPFRSVHWLVAGAAAVPLHPDARAWCRAGRRRWNGYDPRMYMRVMKKYEMVSAERQVPGESGENGGRGASGDATVAEEGAWSTEGRRCVAAPRRDARGRAFAERCMCGVGGCGEGRGGAAGDAGEEPGRVHGQRQGRLTPSIRAGNIRPTARWADTPPPAAYVTLRAPQRAQHSLALSAPRSSITLSSSCSLVH